MISILVLKQGLYVLLIYIYLFLLLLLVSIFGATISNVVRSNLPLNVVTFTSPNVLFQAHMF